MLQLSGFYCNLNVKELFSRGTEFWRQIHLREVWQALGCWVACLFYFLGFWAPIPKDACSCMVYTWALKGLPYHNFGVCICTITLHGRSLSRRSPVASAEAVMAAPRPCWVAVNDIDLSCRNRDIYQMIEFSELWQYDVRSLTAT